MARPKAYIRLRDRGLSTPAWLNVLADAMEEDVAGVHDLLITGQMVEGLREAAEELRNTHSRLDEAIDALAERKEYDIN